MKLNLALYFIVLPIMCLSQAPPEIYKFNTMKRIHLEKKGDIKQFTLSVNNKVSFFLRTVSSVYEIPEISITNATDLSKIYSYYNESDNSQVNKSFYILYPGDYYIQIKSLSYDKSNYLMSTLNVEYDSTDYGFSKLNNWFIKSNLNDYFQLYDIIPPYDTSSVNKNNFDSISDIIFKTNRYIKKEPGDYIINLATEKILSNQKKIYRKIKREAAMLLHSRKNKISILANEGKIYKLLNQDSTNTILASSKMYFDYSDRSLNIPFTSLFYIGDKYGQPMPKSKINCGNIVNLFNKFTDGYYKLKGKKIIIENTAVKITMKIKCLKENVLLYPWERLRIEMKPECFGDNIWLHMDIYYNYSSGSADCPDEPFFDENDTISYSEISYIKDYINILITEFESYLQKI